VQRNEKGRLGAEGNVNSKTAKKYRRFMREKYGKK
jgi:hypothetical protein